MADLTASARFLFGLDPATYQAHALHRGGRSFLETNCYVDLLVEFLHAQGLEPVAMLGTSLLVDFQADQWTFFKPDTFDLERLYGLAINEMILYRPLVEHALEQLEAGHTIFVEMDSFYLPDTAGAAYRRAHVKSSIAIEAVDPDEQVLRYFHNAGYYELHGEDYVMALRDGVELADDVLPPYAEIARLDRVRTLDPGRLRREARVLLRRHLDWRPTSNPLRRFGVRLSSDLPGLVERDEQAFHDYAFATLRQFGAAYETGATFLRWLDADEFEPAAAALDAIVQGAKTLTFKLARRRAFEPGPTVEPMAVAWDEAMTRLDAFVVRAR